MSRAQTNFTVRRPRRPQSVVVQAIDADLTIVVENNPAPLTVPEGSIDTILEWVSDDATRAQAALDVETGKAHARKRLVQTLTSMIE